MKESTRPLSQLYTILLERFDEIHHHGICLKIYSLFQRSIITFDEYNLMRIDFRTNLPAENLHPEFYCHHTFRVNGYWWNLDETEQRKLFIEKLIKIHTENGN